MRHKILWVYLFPFLGTLGYIGFCAFFLRWGPLMLLFLLALPFYIGTALLTIPINGYSLVMAVCALAMYQDGNRNWRHCALASVWTILVSVAFWVSMANGWVISV